MKSNTALPFIEQVLSHLPEDWVNLTTHRLDIYNESLAKTEFLEGFDDLFQKNEVSKSTLASLPTAFDYIRLGHPLSSILEWTVGKLNNLAPERVISFSSKTMPILAILRKNVLEGKNTQILYTVPLDKSFDTETLKTIYAYNFEVKHIEQTNDIGAFEGSTILLSTNADLKKLQLPNNVDFLVVLEPHLGSILLVNGDKNKGYIGEIQHVRRRETIAMTPANCLTALKQILDHKSKPVTENKEAKTKVIKLIQAITGTNSKALVASSGLSIQYAIMMGLIDYATTTHPNKAIKIIIPPNCYGGTNDQARRVAACIDTVEVMDLPVDGQHNMVQSIELVLSKVAKADAIPFIIAEIPTNPRVEVPNLKDLQTALSKERLTQNGEKAIAPVFILDQTFCPNIQFLKADGLLAQVQTISYLSGSKFPSGGKCTAGYCAANTKAEHLLAKIDTHLQLCDNTASDLQTEILAEQMPSMNERIKAAYKNTRSFVSFIQQTLPSAKINFVSEKLAEEGFTPSVFSLDLPTKGNTSEEKEAYKRALNLKLINMMINELPQESKYCVSYGQLKGCYWTIPATSTQGTTKETDKDYIARVSVSPNLNLEKHQAVFKRFVEEL